MPGFTCEFRCVTCQIVDLYYFVMGGSSQMEMQFVWSNSEAFARAGELVGIFPPPERPSGEQNVRTPQIFVLAHMSIIRLDAMRSAVLSHPPLYLLGHNQAPGATTRR
jgi:hypothetical protein